VAYSSTSLSDFDCILSCETSKDHKNINQTVITCVHVYIDVS